ncbi:hypothetical protein D3OALGA1CA_1856 [Olavius algarvensis associated proteobacterium Delta 3]|nr:hypothetical protein D3OALGA1CA_1856 [Olavius algarvensis associated proteobacterium Delta 3]CAB5135560.1 hypothetical protein D3OALGB2SA_3907 [Olavius algarvensis associated proteobacterium Delta 3]
MQKTWSYKNYEIKEGLKPGSAKFRYFFSVAKGDEKKCHYCVWIANDALSRFDPSKDFKAIISSQSETWREWVEAKIDAEDFRNRALKIDAAGQEEINLSAAKEHVPLD